MRRMLMGILVALLAIAPSWAQNATKLDEIVARGTLRVGLTGDYRPFSVLDKTSGQYSGIDVDMANGLATALGVKLEIVPTIWRELLADVNSGKFDIGMGGISVTLDRQKLAFFSIPVMRAGKAAIARCVVKGKYQSLAAIDRAGVRVITNPGGTNERFDRANLKNARIVVFPDNTRIFDELVAGHADLMITDAVETRLQQKLHPELCAINPDHPFDFGELAYLLPRDAIWQQYVNQWLRVSTESDASQKIIDTYLK